MLNDSIRKKIRDYCYDRNFGCDDDEDTIETIRNDGDGKIVRQTLIKENPYHNEYKIIKNFDGMLLQYIDAKIPIYKRREDSNYVFDPNTIKEMEETKFLKLIKGYKEKQ